MWWPFGGISQPGGPDVPGDGSQSAATPHIPSLPLPGPAKHWQYPTDRHTHTHAHAHTLVIHINDMTLLMHLSTSTEPNGYGHHTTPVDALQHAW